MLYSRWCLSILALCSTLTLPACSKAPEVSLTTVKKLTVDSTVNGVSSGTVRAEQSAELAFGAVGRVRGLYVKLGDKVSKGELLAEIENDDMKSGLSRAEAELKRRESMGNLAVSKSDLDTARVAVDSSRIQYERTMIKAPYDGVISEVNLEVGQLSQITAVIPKAPLRIIDVAPRYVKVDIDEVDLPRVRAGLAARIKIPAIGNAPLPATVRKVVPFINSVREQDRTTEVELSIESPNSLLPAGASADVEIVIDSRQNVPALPSRCVFGRGRERFVFAHANGSLKKTRVEVGLSNYDLTEITNGLTVGATVAIPSDVVDYKDEMKVRVLNEESAK